MQALRLFCDVASLNSFSKAALRHGITQSAVSQRIRHLEESLAAQLLDRSVRPFQITEAGQLLLREGRKLVRDYDALVERVRAQPEAGGRVTVGAIYSAGIGLLEGLRMRFEESFPDIEIVLEYHRPEEVAEAVENGTYDFGIISYPNRWPGLSVRRLRNEEMCVVCASDHPLATRKWVLAATLGRFSMACFDAELPVGRDIRRYLRAHGVGTDFAHVVDNIDTVKSLLRDTESVAILPRRTVLRDVEQGALCVVSLRPSLSRPMGIVAAKRSKLSGRAEAFANFLEQHGQATNPFDLDSNSGETIPRAS